jgi:hypothetical protein
VEVAAMAGPLKKYRVTSGSVETVMKLNEGDAAARGLTDSDLVSAEDTTTAAAADSDPHPAAPEDDLSEPDKKAAAPAENKARTTSANKGRSRTRDGAGGGS